MLLEAPDRLMIPRQGPIPPVIRQATNFDGVDDQNARTAQLVGAVDTKPWTFAASFKTGNDPAGALDSWLFENTGLGFQAGIRLGDRFRIAANNFGALSIRSAIGTVAANTWFHLVASANQAVAASGRMRVNGVSDYVENTFVDAALDFTTPQTKIGASVPGSAFWNGCMYYLWLAPGAYFDLDVPAEAEKFWKDGKIVDLGNRGQGPTGAPPLVYMVGKDFKTGFNRGTGEHFVPLGDPGTCADNPSLPGGAP